MDLTSRQLAVRPAPRLRTAPVPDFQAEPFHDDVFCLIPGTDLAVTLIAGAGATLVKRVAHHAAGGPWLSRAREVHTAVGRYADASLLVGVREMPAYEREYGPLRKVGVWRDPVERLSAVHATFCLRGEPHHYFWLADLYDAPLVRLVEFAAFELGKEDPTHQEEHLRPQAATFSLADVDEMVRHDDLPQVLIGAGARLRPGVKLRRPRTRVPAALARRIASLYADDVGRGRSVAR